MFTSGNAVDYGASIIVAKEGDAAEQGDSTNLSPANYDIMVVKQALASNIEIDMRILSFQALNQADARPWQSQEMLRVTDNRESLSSRKCLGCSTDGPSPKAWRST